MGANDRPDEGAAQDLELVREHESVALRAVTGSTFTVAASAVTLLIGFARSVLLARLLLPEHYGLFSLAMFYVRLFGRIQMFGFTAALVHRHPYGDEDTAAHSILRVSGALLVVLISLAAFPVLSRLYPDYPTLSSVVFGLGIVQIFTAVNATPMALLSKELEFKRIAVLKVAGSATALGLGVLTAWHGGGPWSLVVQEAGIELARIIGLWLYRRPWSPKLRTSWKTIKWYFEFGWPRLVTANLTFLLDRFDDFWVGTTLGGASLGLYSKAYEFARYPRAVVGAPLIQVFFPTFARLQHDRVRLSKAYFRVCSLMVRAGFFLSGVFALVAREFIQVFLGSKWLPMASTFQVMLLYTLFDPLLSLSGELATAVGEPQLVARVNLYQAIVFVPSVIVLSHFFGINGVAVAADFMLVQGLVLMLRRVKRYVDFSLWRMAGYPILALALAMIAGILIGRKLPQASNLLSFLSKSTTVAFVYCGVLALIEWRDLVDALRLVHGLVYRARARGSLAKPRSERRPDSMR